MAPVPQPATAGSVRLDEPLVSGLLPLTVTVERQPKITSGELVTRPAPAPSPEPGNPTTTEAVMSDKTHQYNPMDAEQAASLRAHARETLAEKGYADVHSARSPDTGLLEAQIKQVASAVERVQHITGQLNDLANTVLGVIPEADRDRDSQELKRPESRLGVLETMTENLHRRLDSLEEAARRWEGL